MKANTQGHTATTAQPNRDVSNVNVSEQEALAGLRVLISVAKADGALDADKRKALENAFAGLKLPAGLTPQALLEEQIDLEAQLRLLASPAARESTYQSALGLVQLDGQCTPAEKQVLDHVRATLRIDDQEASLARKVLDEAKDTVLPSNIKPETDPAKRAAAVKSDTLKYSVISGVLGSFPIPGIALATDLAVVGVQVKLVRDIGQRFGHTVDKKAALSLLGGLGLGTGARIAVSNLAKLVPGWGSVFGASASFASTWALAKIADSYFESGMKADPASLRTDFKAAQAKGKAAFDANKGLVESKRVQSEEKIRGLSADLAAGRISQREFSTRVEQMA